VPAPGQEVTIDYGDKSNEQLLFLYGFAELDNPAEVLTLIFPLPPPGEWDETLAARVELLQRRGLRPQLHLSAADLAASCATGSTKDENASSPLPEGVMETLEVFMLSPQQLQQELQGASPGVADGASSSSSSSEGLGSSSGRVPGMAVLTTLLRLLELKVAEMEGVEDGAPFDCRIGSDAGAGVAQWSLMYPLDVQAELPCVPQAPAPLSKTRSC
jgi:hypothetical protein